MRRLSDVTGQALAAHLDCTSATAHETAALQSTVTCCYLRDAGVVDICLIPEVKFELPALTRYVKHVMKQRGHCVVCIAEGAGQDIVQHGHAGKDKSGNPILKDIGTHLRDTLKESMEVSETKT